MEEDRALGPDAETVVWIRPGNYPRACTAERAEQIASMILQGASPVAAAASIGVSRRRLRAWYQRGADAEREDAGSEHRDSPYLAFYLMVNQALGITTVRAQIRIREQAPQWWITHHPDTRGDFGGDAGDSLSTLEEPPAEFVEQDAATVAPTAPSSGTMRDVLRTLIVAGAAQARTDDDTTPNDRDEHDRDDAPGDSPGTATGTDQ